MATTGAAAGGCLDTGQFMFQKGTTIGSSLGSGHIENWGESGIGDNSQQTDTSTDVDTDDKNQVSFVSFLIFSLYIRLYVFVFCKSSVFFYLHLP